MDGRLAGFGQKLPSKPVESVSAAPATASHRLLMLQDCINILFERLAKVTRRRLHWVGQGSRRGLNWETNKPRGSHPLNRALTNRRQTQPTAGKSQALVQGGKTASLDQESIKLVHHPRCAPLKGTVTKLQGYKRERGPSVDTHDC